MSTTFNRSERMRRLDLWSREREAAEVLEPFGVRVLRGDSPRPTVKVWRPKATKPEVNYSFRSVEQRESYVQKWLENFATSQAVKANRKAAKAAAAFNGPAITVGTIFCHSWGYEQTNLDWYEVVRVTASGKTVVVKAIGSEEVPGSAGRDCGHFTARPGAFLEGRQAKELRKTVQFLDSGAPYLSFEYGWCEMWNGQPRYCSWYA